MGIITIGRGVGGSVTLSTRLDPDESVDQLIARVGRWAGAEAGVLDVAPVAPFVLTGGLVSVAAYQREQLSYEAIERGI